MIEPSDAEQACWPDCTRDYVSDMEQALEAATNIIARSIDPKAWAANDCIAEMGGDIHRIWLSSVSPDARKYQASLDAARKLIGIE